MSALVVMEPGPDEIGHEGRCNSPKKQGPGRCRKPAGWGTPHLGVGACKMHLGNSPSHVRAGRRMLAERGAARSLAEVGYEPVEDPYATLADVAGRAVAMSEHFANRVAELDEYRYRSDVDTEQLRAELTLLKDFMSMAGKMAADLARLGFEDRKVRVDEATAGMLVACMTAMLRHLGHDPEQIIETLDLFLPMLDGQPAPAVIDVREAG